jgi:phage gpG-like protein
MINLIFDAAQVQRMLHSPEGPVGRGLLVPAIRVEGAIKRRCPVDTGRLRSSITHSLGHGPAGLVAVVGTNVRYAGWVNRGTGIYGPHHTPIVPVHASMLRFKPRGSSNYVYARSVRGMPGRHFMALGLRDIYPSAVIRGAGLG